MINVSEAPDQDRPQDRPQDRTGGDPSGLYGVAPGDISGRFLDPVVGAAFEDIWAAVERHRHLVIRAGDEARDYVARMQASGAPLGPVPPEMVARAYLAAVIGLFSGVAAVALPRPPAGADPSGPVMDAIERNMMSKFNVLIATLLTYRTQVYRDPSQPVAGGGGGE